MTDAQLLRRAIDLSGLPDRQFAIGVAEVNERTVRRWLFAGPALQLKPRDRRRLTEYIEESTE